MADFTQLVKWLIYQEDSHRTPGIISNLGDGAGLTRLGITSKNFALAVPGTFFSTLPFAEAVAAAKQVYKNSYWDKFHGDQLPDQIAAPLLSFAVNRNVPIAVKTLQHVLEITPDGIVGPGTVSVLGQKDPAIVSKLFRAEWEHFYHNVVALQPSDQRFLDGWIARANFPYPSSLVPNIYD